MTMPRSCALAALCVVGCVSEGGEQISLSTRVESIPPDLLAGFVPEPAADAAASFRESVCAEGCAAAAACGDADERCVEACVEDAAASASSVATPACERTAECGNRGRCTDAPAAQNPACANLCEAMAACDAFPHGRFGPDEAACVALCNGSVVGDAAEADRVACYQERFELSCGRGGTGACDADVGEMDDCATMCLGIGGGECSGIPGAVWTTIAGCLDDCRGRGALAQLQMRTCVNVSGCDRYERCFPLMTQAAPGCDVFCDAWVARCDSPLLSDLVCQSVCRGLYQAAPGARLAGAAPCIEATAYCPLDETLIACITPEDERCGPICEALVPCGLSAEQCPAQCGLIAALEPDDMDEITDCSVSASCATIGACFD